MIGSIPIPNTRFYLTSIAEAFRENEREKQEFPEKLEEAAKKAYGNGLHAGRHSKL